MNAEWQEAVERDAVNTVRALLDANADIDQRDKYGQTAIWIATEKGYTDLVRLLIERGANLNITAKYHLTPLMLSITLYRYEIARLLIEVGADFTTRGGKGAVGFNGKTALMLAQERVEALKGQMELVDLLRRAGARE